MASEQCGWPLSDSITCLSLLSVAPIKSGSPVGALFSFEW